MSAKEYAYIVKLLELLMADGDEPHLSQAFAFHAIVHDVA